MQSAEGAAQGLDYQYELFDLDLIEGGRAGLPALLDRLEAAGYVGINVTHPCKQQVIPYLTELSPEASVIGAVNTVVLRGRPQDGPQHRLVGLCRGVPADRSRARRSARS